MIKVLKVCIMFLVVHLIVLDVYLLVSESGYRTVPVTLSIDNSDRHPYLCLESLWPTVMLKNITKVEPIVELGHKTEWRGNRNV